MAVAFQIEQDGAGCGHTNPSVRRQPEFFVLIRADVGHRLFYVGPRGRFSKTSRVCSCLHTPSVGLTARVSRTVQAVDAHSRHRRAPCLHHCITQIDDFELLHDRPLEVSSQDNVR